MSWDTRLIEHHRRLAPEQWLVTLLRAGTLALSSIDVTLEIAALWVDLDRLGRTG